MCFIVVFRIFLFILQWRIERVIFKSTFVHFIITFSRKLPHFVSNYLPLRLNKFDLLLFTLNFVLSKLRMLSCVFVLNLVRKTHLFELKLLG